MLTRKELLRKYHKLIIALIDVALAWKRLGVASSANDSYSSNDFLSWIYTVHGWYLPGNGTPPHFFSSSSHTAQEEAYCKALGLDATCAVVSSTQFTCNGVLLVMAMHEGLLRYDYHPQRHRMLSQRTGRKHSRSVRHAIALTPEGERLLKLRHRAIPWAPLSLSLLLLTLWRLSESAWRLYRDDREQITPCALVRRLYDETGLPVPDVIPVLEHNAIPEGYVVLSPEEIELFDRLQRYASHVNPTMAAFSEFMQQHCDAIIDMAGVQRIL